MMPFISIVIPTYNAQKYLKQCLKSIFKQSYPRSSYEVLIVDGGSSDRTLNIAKQFKTRILKNKYKDAESGKAIGISKAKGQIIALIDADNELVNDNWLEEMVYPFVKHKQIFGVESRWLVNKKHSLLNQYFAMLEIADPLARRFHPKVQVTEYKRYFLHKVKVGETPIIGANGFLYRKKFIDIIGYGSKFEEVNFVAKLVNKGYVYYAVPKSVGIYHHYVSSLSGYIKKRIKIGNKFMNRKMQGQATWVDQSNNKHFFSAVFYNITLIGPVIESISQMKKTKNIAWLWHPIISFVTVVVYGIIFLKYKLKKL